MNTQPTIWTPAMLARLHELWPTAASTHVIANELGVSQSAISRKAKREGMPKRCERPLPALKPENMRQIAPGLYLNEFCRRFRCGDVTAKRWAQEEGVSFKVWTGWNAPSAAPIVDHRANTLATRAQVFLQHDGPVWAEGPGYRVFGRRMSTADMIAMAERKGFEPNEWRRCAPPTLSHSAVHERV